MKTILIFISLLSALLANIGSVTSIQGSANLQHQSKILEVTKGLTIEEKDTLITQTRSKVQVILNDDTVITIGPKSKYTFETYQDGDNSSVSMHLHRGFFKAVTGKIGKLAPERFKIKTKAATIGIRGTQFMAFVGENEEKIGCIQGKITVATAEEIFDINAGEMIIYSDGKWTIQKMDMNAFSPVMVGIRNGEHTDGLADFHLPGLQDSYLLEEQIVDDRANGEQPFSFGLSNDATTQPPSFNP